jgi:asparagine synthase (glutamine-hydrolysing)
MAERLAHRGPDGDGFYSFVTETMNVHLAHRRLAVTGGEAGQQPMMKHSLAVSYDGELYNHRELRAELASHGSTFETTSDTEVVLEAWRRWGPGCLRKFRGMFALALFDEVKRSLYLARDHLGIKPLHYICRKDGAVFASELKALVAAFGAELEVEPSSLIASVLYYWVPGQRCSLYGVQKLQPGTWAEWRPDGSHHVRPYFDIAEFAAAAAAGPPVNLPEVIEGSVNAHLNTDVRAATFLSGGLDSGIVTVLAKRTRPDIEAFTVIFRPEDQRLEAMPDDAAYARRIAQRNGIRLHEIPADRDVAGLLPRLVDIMDEPTGDPAAVNTLLMSQAARDLGVKVVLSGIGADEIFGGYRKHLGCLLAERYRHLPGPARRATRTVVAHLPVTVGGRGLQYPRWAKQFLTFAELPEEAAFRRSYSLFDPAELTALLSPELGPDVDELLGEHFEVYSDNFLADRVNRMCLADVRMLLPGLVLTYTDRASMAASVEVRLPFVDPVVFRAAFSLDGEHKISGTKGKVALKQAARSWLPREIIDRRQASFSVPLRAWVRRDLRQVVDDLLLHGELVGTGFLQAVALRQLVAEDRAGRRDRSKQIWHLLTLELWYRQACQAGVAL